MHLPNRIRCGIVAVLLGLVCAAAIAADPRIGTLEEALVAVAPLAEAEKPEQIPATVVDTGVLRYVPYVSFTVGPDIELNIYGDPANPTCIEIGLYRGLSKTIASQRKCIAILQRLVPEVDMSSVSLTGGRMLRGGVVAEVTTPDEPDAYGGWWISCYSLSRLHGEPASKGSTQEVSEDRAQSGWTASDFSRLKGGTGSSEGGAARVYVRAYVRKDGSYVPAHTRAKSKK